MTKTATRGSEFVKFEIAGSVAQRTDNTGRSGKVHVDDAQHELDVLADDDWTVTTA